MKKHQTIDKNQISQIVSLTNNLTRALVQAGGTGLIKPIMDMSVGDFLLLLVNNNIALDATYYGD